MSQQSQSSNQSASSMASNSELATSSLKLKRNSDDIGWEFGMLCNPMDQDKWKCIKCGKEFSGGVYRIKLHIAGKRGNVTPCLMASPEDQKRCLDALDGAKKKKIEKPPRTRTLGPMDRYVSEIKVDGNSVRESKRSTQQNMNDALYKEPSHQVHQYLARWLYESGLPFHVVDSDSFKQIVEAVGEFGPGYQPPSKYQLKELLLKGEVERKKKRKNGFQQSASRK